MEQRYSRFLIFLNKAAEWSLYLLIFALPFSKSIVEIMIVTGIICVVLKKLILRDYSIPKSAIDILLYVFLLCSLPSLINTSFMSLSLKAFFSKSLKFAALFLITKEIIDTKVKLRNFLTMAVISCIVILIDASIQHFVTYIDVLHNYPSFNYTPPLFERNNTFPTASFPFPNDFAAWMLIFLFPLGVIALLARKHIAARVVAVATFIPLFYFFVITKVRGAWIGFLISSVMLMFIKFKKAVIVVLACLILSILLMNRNIIPDMLSVKSSVSDRAVMWNNGWKIFMKHPVIGNGLNTFYVEYRSIREDKYKNERGSYAHNCYLQMAADTGIVGLGSFLLFIFWLIVTAFKSLGKISDYLYYALVTGITLGLVAYLLHSIVDTNLYSLNLAALFWVSAGVLLSTIKIAGSEN